MPAPWHAFEDVQPDVRAHARRLSRLGLLEEESSDEKSNSAVAVTLAALMFIYPPGGITEEPDAAGMDYPLARSICQARTNTAFAIIQ